MGLRRPCRRSVGHARRRSQRLCGAGRGQTSSGWRAKALTVAAPPAEDTAADLPREKLTRQQLWALAILGVLTGFNMVDRGLLALNLEPIKLELGATDTQMSIAAGIGFFLMNALAGIPLARLADRYSRRDIIAIGFGFYSFIIGAMGMVTSFAGLLATRMLLGIGEASGNAP